MKSNTMLDIFKLNIVFYFILIEQCFTVSEFN